MSTIIDAVIKVGGAIIDALRGINYWLLSAFWRAAKIFFGVPAWAITAGSWIAAGVIAVWGISRNAAEYLQEFVVFLGGKVGAMSVGDSSVPTGWTATLATANTFIPLDELMTLSSSFFVLFALCAVIRIIKSLIPTIA